MSAPAKASPVANSWRQRADARPLRVAVSAYIGPARTGIARTLENLLQRVEGGGGSHDFVVFRNRDMADLQVPRGEMWKERLFRVSCHSSIGNLLWHQFVYPLRLWREGADVSFIPNVTLLMWKVCPTVVMIHDMIEFHVPRKFSRLRMLYRRVAVPMTARRADVIVTVSEHSRRDIVRTCGVPKEKVMVAPNGVDERFRPCPESEVSRVRQKLGVEGRYLLYVGTLDHPGKNAMAVIRIFAELQRRGLVDRLVLVGRPGFGYNHLLAEIDRRQIRKSVVLTGHIADEDLMPLYSGASTFAFLSYYEGFGLPALEAMACGAPTVVSNRSCLPEVVGDGALLVDPDDVAGAVEVFSELLSSPRRQNELRDRGMQRARSFHWGHSCEVLLSALARAVGRTATASAMQSAD